VYKVTKSSQKKILHNSNKIRSNQQQTSGQYQQWQARRRWTCLTWYGSPWTEWTIEGLTTAKMVWAAFWMI